MIMPIKNNLVRNRYFPGVLHPVGNRFSQSRNHSEPPDSDND